MKIVLSYYCIVLVVIAFLPGCRPLRNGAPSHSVNEELAHMPPRSYIVHHLLDDDPSAFVTLCRSKMPEGARRFRKTLIERTNTYKLGGDEVVDAAIVAQERIAVETILASLRSPEYNSVRGEARRLLGARSVNGFLALESFGRPVDSKSAVIHSYEAAIIFDTDDGSFVLENISEESIFQLHESAWTVRDALDVLSQRTWTCTLSPVAITELGLGNIVILTCNCFGAREFGFIPNLAVWNADVLRSSGIELPEESKVFIDAYRLLSESW